MTHPMQSWIDVPPESDFSIHNLPFGIFKPHKRSPRIGVAIGNKVIDVAALVEYGYMKEVVKRSSQRMLFYSDSLNGFISQGKAFTRNVRGRVMDLMRADNPGLSSNRRDIQRVIFDKKDVTMMLPVKIGNYTDFYSSLEHATNLGAMFRDPKNALLPNWKHIPVGYHGRASSIVLSGVDIHRPKGQMKSDDAENPVFGPTRQLDFELEMAFITHQGKPLGQSISTSEADDYIFGMVIFNDWSARDIQKWEYVPLGPFLGKNFGSSISPWVVMLDALEPFRTAGPVQEPQVMPYLQYSGKKNLEINLEILIQPEGSEPVSVSHSNTKYLYWNMNQQLAHHTINGCNINAGDTMASGTISGLTPDSYGSMIELTWKGTKPIQMSDGTERKFINDGDTVIMHAWSEKDGIRVGFGEVKAKILPALP